MRNIILQIVQKVKSLAEEIKGLLDLIETTAESTELLLVDKTMSVQQQSGLTIMADDESFIIVDINAVDMDKSYTIVTWRLQADGAYCTTALRSYLYSEDEIIIKRGSATSAPYINISWQVISLP